MSAGQAVHHAADEVRHNSAVQALGRAGMVCYGIVHILVAWLCVQVIFGDPGQRTDQTGAIAEVAAQPFGVVLLWVLGIGLFAYGLWQFLLAALGYGWVLKRRSRLGRKVGAVARGVVGIALGVVAVRIAVGSGGGSSGGSGGSGGSGEQQELTARLLALPAGRMLVGVAALVVLGVAANTVRKGVTKRFEQDLDMTALPTGTRRWVRRLGLVGWTSKGAAYAVIGVLVGLAALRANAAESGGLDKALHTLAAQPFGVLLLALMALGFAAFGVYCFAAARAHRS